MPERERNRRLVDLSAIRHNVRVIRSLVPYSARLLAVVKADAYGHGSAEVAAAALKAGANFLAVATVPEGKNLRMKGISAPILVLGESTAREMETAAFEDITIAVSSVEDIRMASEAAEAMQKTLCLHLKVDTGMGRIGVRTLEERNQVLAEFKDRAGEVVTGYVSRKSDDKIYINLDKAEGVLPFKEQVPGEHYNVRQRIKVYIVKVLDESKGPQVLVSRTRSELVRSLFESEVPEIQDGIVEIKGIARDPGSRTKIAVYSEDPNVDPVGACVGTRGTRVQSIVDELNGEKIDIVFWSEDPVELISSVLSPADVEEVIIEDEEAMTATVIVPDSQLSLAIGKRGQNVSLAAKVSKWKIDIKSHSDYYSDDYDDEIPNYDEVDAEPSEDEAAEAEEE